MAKNYKYGIWSSQFRIVMNGGTLIAYRLYMNSEPQSKMILYLFGCYITWILDFAREECFEID